MQATSPRGTVAGWAAIAVLFAATTCVESMSWTQLTAYTPLYLRELHVPAAQVPGWIAAMSSLGWILALPLAPFWGVLADRYSRKLVIVRSAAIEAVVFAGWALATSPVIALVFRSLNGFILGNTGVMLAVQASTTPRQRLALAVGIVGAGSPAGRALGPILGAALVHIIDVRGMLLVDSALSVLMAILLSVFMRESQHERPADLRVLSLLRGALDEIVSKPLVWRLFLATTIVQVGLWTMLPYVAIYIGRLATSDPVTAVGVVLSAVGLGQAIASPLWGIAIQRVGHRAVLNATSIGAAVALTTVALSHSLPVFAFGLIANGVFAGAILTASMAVLASTVSPERRGAVLGQILFPFYLGGVLGPPLGALAFGAGQPVVFGIAAVLSLAPLVVLLTMRTTRQMATP
ncbi:MAG TPA: MFS transporter [Candidatus Dormibacteraeota bacterium]|jgi:MFS family permease|nr:MFS transporter [Candidatus Dormibacteraeota bacterium]